MFDRNKGASLTQKIVNVQNETRDRINAGMSAERFVKEKLQPPTNYQEFSRQKEIPDVLSYRFYSQPSISKTGDSKWTVSSYVEYDATVKSGPSIPFLKTESTSQKKLRKYFTVDLNLLSDGEATLNNIQLSDTQK